MRDSSPRLRASKYLVSIRQPRMIELSAIAAQEAEARQALGERRTDRVLTLGRALVARHPERPAGWIYQALAVLLDGRADILYRRLLPARRKRGCDGVLFLKDVFLMLAQHKAHDTILAAAAKAPGHELYTIIPSYFAACVLLERRQFDQGFALLTAVRNRCLASLATLPTEDSDGFMVLFRHALLVNDHTFLKTTYFRDNLALNRAKLGPLHWAQRGTPAAAADAVIVVSCDQRYAELFLPRFFTSVTRWCHGRLIHLHLIDPEPTPPDPGHLPPVGDNALALTWEHSGELKCSAWYASIRFVRAAALLEHYQRPIVIFDVDVALTQAPKALEAILATVDFGCFRMDRLDPGSVYQASVTAFRPTPAGLELARLLHDLILAKMSIQQPLLWLIDQASLYSAITWLGDQCGRLRVADFTAELAQTVEEYVAFCDRNDEKLRLMKLASGVGDDEHRNLWSLTEP